MTIANLLINNLKLDSQPDESDQLNLLTEQEWNELIQLAKQLHVFQLFYHRLKIKKLTSTIPRSINNDLQKIYHQHTMRNIRLFAELNRVVKTFHKKGIPVIALKGAHLAGIIYDDIAHRQLRDLDLLIPTKDLNAAGDILRSNGYTQLPAQNPEHDFKIARHVPPFVNPKGTYIELHWNITPRNAFYTIDPSELWERAEHIKISGVEIYGLSPEDLLLHVCFHLAYSDYFQAGLKAVCDIATIINHYGTELNWTEILSRTMKWNWQRGVYLALWLAENMMDAGIPHDVLHQLQSADISLNIRKTVETHILYNETSIMSKSKLSDILHIALGTKRTSVKLSLAMKKIFQPTRVIAEIYSLPPGSWRVFLYYMVRTKDMFTKYRRISHLLNNEEEPETKFIRNKSTIVEWLNRIQD